ncbi:unnamed protein product [Brachionus calyciflorus]|uniref:Uncharacterized protein n=1 Tax=Brachionus calyciflorus TaxID=104777 RepID=A0A814GCB8_9BILA|nr:unnamed protein product [Brachionus calyciflorus]
MSNNLNKDDILSIISANENFVPYLKSKNIIRSDPPNCPKCNKITNWSKKELSFGSILMELFHLYNSYIY